MQISSFAVEQQRAIRLATCDVVPKLMIIAGPNGCGKSTVLNAIKMSVPEAVYIGPHRTSRRQNVQYRHLLNQEISIAKLFTHGHLPQFEGIAMLGGNRDAWGFDEGSNYIKHGLCQIEMERQQALAARFDRDGEIVRATVQDPWQPLRRLAASLLPHLKFDRIETTNRNEVRCLWRAHGADTDIDIDDLSSGEKSIIQLFYPLIEHQVKALISEIKREPLAEEARHVALLIDEPELHLHPSLQLKVLEYMRAMVAVGTIQIIVATHSPTMVEHAEAQELFLLKPAELTVAGENQLVQIATDDDKLAMLRDTFGTTANLTALQPVIVVEGVDETGARKVVADRKMYRALSPRIEQFTVVSGGGKGECIKLRKVLANAIGSFAGSLRVIALLDRDVRTAGENLADGVMLLPVSTIENFMVDPKVIWQALQSVIEKTPFKSVVDVAAALDEIIEEQSGAEAERRVLAALESLTFRASKPIAEIAEQRARHVVDLENRFSQDRVVALTNEALGAVTDIAAKCKRRELFDGKAILGEFISRFLHPTGMSKAIFMYEVARHASSRRSVAEFFDTFHKVAIGDAS